MKLRTCMVCGRKALFHKWIEEKYIQSAFIQGTVGGQISHNYALVEFENGKCEFVTPVSLIFLDNIFKDYCFDKLED